MYGILERAGVNLTAVNYAKSAFEVYTDLFADILGWGHQPTLMLTGQWIDDCSLSYVIPSGVEGETFVKRKPVSKSLSSTHGSLRALVKWMTAIDLNIVATNTRKELARSIYEVLQGKLCTKDGSQIPRGFEQWLSRFQTFIASGSLAFEQLQTTIDADAETGAWHQLCLETLRSQRSLRVTTGGRFGSGPLEMTAGDRVALVSNVSVPLVFRRTPQDSEVDVFVGSAFVAGIMAGELWNDVSENRFMVV